MTGLAEVYAWSSSAERVVSCHVCTVAVTVGVDAHSDVGRSLLVVRLSDAGDLLT